MNYSYKENVVQNVLGGKIFSLCEISSSAQKFGDSIIFFYSSLRNKIIWIWTEIILNAFDLNNVIGCKRQDLSLLCTL